MDDILNWYQFEKNSETGKILMKKHETIFALKKHESKK